MQIVTVTQPQILRLMLISGIDEIVLTDEAENVNTIYTEFTTVDKGYYYEITIDLNLVNNRFYKIEAKFEGALICYDKLYCTDGTDNRFTQRVTQNTFITL
jgi:hypothetical protein